MLKIIPLLNFPIIQKDDNISEQIYLTLQKNDIALKDFDILVVAQIIVSRAEGRLINLETIKPSILAQTIAENSSKDPRHVEIILREAKNICKNRNGVLVTETHHGFVCANSGVDKSNVPGKNMVALLPENPDNSAKKIRLYLEKKTGKKIAVLISDTHSRPFRLGAINIAIGCSGLEPMKNYCGKRDLFDYELKTTKINLADQICSAAGLFMGECAEGKPVILIRGKSYIRGEISAKTLLRKEEKDYFR
ncbi:MAG: coenzyme F420-0:L-glutamate ligase [Asgard group archaeon]|nr:coenzyme F420-0:L-glutamate ligase [Asgard group archaeon]